ncbi:MAG: thiamine phosphate synthase [Bacteroidota bacterium]|nr:thiamine phosphate synthase [Bacteroidota bacterium]
MKVVVVTEKNDPQNEFSVINQLFKDGLKVLHVRKPDKTEKEMYDWLSQIHKSFRKRLVLHQHHNLVTRFKCKGYHFTENDRARKSGFLLYLKLLKFFGAKFSLSTSFHELASLKSSNKFYTYVFFSPVFKSISKENSVNKVSLRKLYDVLKSSKVKAFALGGIELDKIEPSSEAGFKGVALLGAIWLTEDPIKAFKEIKKKCKDLGNSDF